MAYITDADLKLALGITESTRDDLITWANDGAARRIDEKTRGAKAGGAFALDDEASARVYTVRHNVYCDEDGEVLLVDDIGSTDDLKVEVSNGISYAELDSSAYETTPDNALATLKPITGVRMVDGRWSVYRKVRVTAKWGWPEVPDDIVNANLMQATRWFRRKDSPEGVAGSADWGLVRVPNLDPDVRAVVANYAKPGFA